MKIMLVSPPFYRILGLYNRYYPFALVLLGTILKKEGYQVAVYDADFYLKPETINYAQILERETVFVESLNDKNNKIWDEVIKNIKKYKPDVLGISVYTTFAGSSFHLAKLVKKALPKCKIVMGGPHATVKADEILKICRDVDYVIRGEAEESFKGLIAHLRDKKKGEIKVLGVSYRKGKKIIHNGNSVAPTDLDKYPSPDRSILLNEKQLSSEDMGLVMTSRGCPFRCTYCASTKGIRYRSVDNVIKEITEVKRKYGTVQFTLKDDSFTVDKKRVKEFCQKLIDLKINIKWECNTRVNLIDEEMLRIMKKAGLNFIKVGVESGSQKMIERMNKGITLDQIRKAAQLFRKLGIHWTGYFMMGVVGETEEDIYETVKFLNEVKPNLGVIAVYEAFPGTVMFEEGKKLGLYRDDMSLKDFYTMTPETYYKKDPKIQNDRIKPERFDEIEAEVNQAFYKNNRNLINVYAMGRSKMGVYLRDPKILIEDAKKLLSY
ncbi:B12-binding domain-containing radical SAM protein [Patescibacteria group bacterium]|nr:B12-binding domain-containing radical SAM protein [Patescibacteria group bacterium]